MDSKTWNDTIDFTLINDIGRGIRPTSHPNMYVDKEDGIIYIPKNDFWNYNIEITQQLIGEFLEKGNEYSF